MKTLYSISTAVFLVLHLSFAIAKTPSGHALINAESIPLLTEPPERFRAGGEIALVSHPRLLITEQSLPGLRKKLADPVYAADLAALAKSKHPNNLAFQYLVFGDRQAGEKAKQALLTGKVPRMGGMEKAITKVQFALLYDWLYSLLTPTERKAAVERIRKVFKLGQKKTKKKKDKKKKRGDGLKHYYFNDSWARGAAFSTLLALALAEDLDWARDVVRRAASGSHRNFSPYSGGAVDVLNSLALDSGGGHQAGIKNGPGTGYESMFLIGAGLFIQAWATATGDPLPEKTNYFEKFPNYITYAYQNFLPIGEAGKQNLEYATAANSKQARGLAGWLLKREGRAKYGRLFRVIIGDLTKAEPQSPESLGLPLATYLNGADLVVSRTGWGSEAISVYMFARHWDTSRYEPESGVISIYKGSKPILVRGIDGKQAYSIFNNSGIWIWTDKKLKATLGQGSTYWNKLNNLPKSTLRALSAEAVFDRENYEYRPNTLKSFQNGAEGMVAEVEYSSLLKQKGVKEARRRISHHGNLIKVLDTIEAPKNANVAVSFRLAEVPEISGDTITLQDATIKIISPNMLVEWKGGVGTELHGPMGKWHGHKKHGYKPGYGKNKGRVKKYGLGNLFVRPIEKATTYKFEFSINVH